jgi:formylglycine-generating enzyme required for sulfatase activity
VFTDLSGLSAGSTDAGSAASDASTGDTGRTEVDPRADASDGAASDAGADSAVDTGVDAGPEDAALADVGTDATVGADAAADAGSDAGADAGSGPPCNTSRDCTNGGQCVNQQCTTPKSCTGVAKTCGALDNEDCCTSLLVPTTNGADLANGGSASPITATLSAYRLDKFEVTVERFRKFVDAYQNPGAMVAEGAGAHPTKPGKYELMFQQTSGWDPAWAGSMPANATDLRAAVVQGNPCFGATFTNAANADADHRAMHCVSWYEAYLFCAWDGGRLPTLGELFNAAIGGTDQRPYPWGGASHDATRVQYDKAYGTKPEPVGKKPAGNGRWGHADLYGNVDELTFDWLWTGRGSGACVDCFIMGNGNRTLVGGNIALPLGSVGPWKIDQSGITVVKPSSATMAQNREAYAGLRCARYVQ